MATLTVNITEERLGRLAELAESSKLTPEQVVQAHLDSTLLADDEEFRRAAAYVFGKNQELYRRLA